MRLQNYITEAPSIMSKVMQDWRTWLKKNRDANYIENDVVGRNQGMGMFIFEFQYADIDPNWFEKQFLKKYKSKISKIVKGSRHITVHQK